MKYCRLFLLLVISLLSAGVSHAGNQDKSSSLADSLSLASKAYADGRPGEAVEIYNSLMASHGESPEILFNLGNAYYKEGKTGQALASYKKAHRLAPSDRRINSNIEFIRNYVSDCNSAASKDKKIDISTDTPSFLQRMNSATALTHTSNTWAVWACVCFLLAVAGIAVYFFVSPVLPRKIGFFSSLVLLILCGIFVAFSFLAANYSSSHDAAVIVERDAVIRELPADTAEMLTPRLHPGTELTILDHKESAAGDSVSWTKVRLNAAVEGWIMSDDFVSI